MLPRINGIGNLTADPELKFTPSGKAVCNIRLAFNESKRDANGNWENVGEPVYLGTSLWEDDAEAAAEHLRKGQRVHVEGFLRPREYESQGQNRTALELTSAIICPTIPRKQGGGGAPAASSAPASNGWGSSPAAASSDPWGSRP